MKKMTKRPKLGFGPTLSGGLSLCAIVQFALVTIAATNGAQISPNKNHRMGEISALQQQADSQLMNYTSTTTTSASTNTNEPVTSMPDIVIDSIEDELGGIKSSLSAGAPAGLGASGNRHRYEQQQTSLSSQRGPQDQQIDVQPVKLEARNQMDSSSDQARGQFSHQQDPVIIDHRPSVNGDNTDQPMTVMSQQHSSDYSSTQVPPVASTFAPPSPTTAAYGQQQQQPQPGTISVSAQLAPQWASNGQSSTGKPASQHQFYFAQSQPQTQAAANQQYGSMMSGSHQVATIQHPTSINSIISEQQQQPSQGQVQLATVNGQPSSLVYVNQPQGSATATNGISLLPLQQQQQLMGMAQNGRRVSISNWLRGIGSMLANIFNRRDHASASALQQAMLASSPSAFIVQAPTQQQQQQQQASTSSTSTSGGGGGWIQLGPNAPHWLTQAQSAIQQLQHGSNRFTTFIQAAPQLVQSASPVIYQQAGDLQASGSSNSYVSIQSPSGVSLATNQPYQSGPIMVATQQQQQQQPQPQPQPQVASTVIQPQHQQAQQQTSRQQQAITGQVQSNQQAVEQLAKQQPSSGTQNQARFSRSYSGPQAASGGPTKQQANGNLPLTHYSQYSTPSD